MEDPHSVLLETLDAMRLERGLSGKKWAVELGIRQQHWSMLKKGDRHFGPRVLTRIRRRFPHLKALVIAVLVALGETGEADESGETGKRDAA